MNNKNNYIYLSEPFMNTVLNSQVANLLELLDKEDIVFDPMLGDYVLQRGQKQASSLEMCAERYGLETKKQDTLKKQTVTIHNDILRNNKELKNIKN